MCYDIAAIPTESPNTKCSLILSYLFPRPHDLALLTAVYVDDLAMHMAAEIMACERQDCHCNGPDRNRLAKCSLPALAKICK